MDLVKIQHTHEKSLIYEAIQEVFKEISSANLEKTTLNRLMSITKVLDDSVNMMAKSDILVHDENIVLDPKLFSKFSENENFKENEEQLVGIKSKLSESYSWYKNYIRKLYSDQKVACAKENKNENCSFSSSIRDFEDKVNFIKEKLNQISASLKNEISKDDENKVICVSDKNEYYSIIKTILV